MQVNWSPPKFHNGFLEGFTVYYRPQSINVGPVQSIKVSAAENSVVIESDFQGNVTYELWVKARNRKLESSSSKLVQLTFDSTSNIDAVTGLKAVVNEAENSLVLSWTKLLKAEGYVVQLVLPHPYPKIEPIKTDETQITIKNLVPGSQYVARVSAYVKNYTGRSQTQVIKRSGTPLPEIINITNKHEGDHIRISWTKPSPSTHDKYTYGIYYGTSLEELFDCK